MYTGYVAYSQHEHCIQVIDYYRNFIRYRNVFKSKTIFEAILLSFDHVERAQVARHCDSRGMFPVKLWLTSDASAEQRADVDSMVHSLNGKSTREHHHH